LGQFVFHRDSRAVTYWCRAANDGLGCFADSRRLAVPAGAGGLYSPAPFRAMAPGDAMTGTATTEYLLQAQGLRESFQGVKAVNGMDLRVQAGSITGLIGPNGCGKSTTIYCLTGFQSIDGGTVEFEGHSIAGKRP